MSVQKIGMSNPLRSVPFEAAARVAGMAMSNQKLLGEAVMKLLDSSQIITDPALGNRVNLLA